MAGYYISSLKPNEVSEKLRTSAFALRWSEEANKPASTIVVSLSVDIKGYYIICLNKMTKAIECFDIALIHDTRNGPTVTIPRGALQCPQFNTGPSDVPLESKWLTIYYGDSFIPGRELRVIHFCFYSPDIAKEWAEQLFQYGHNPLLRNLSSLECLEKLHSRIVNGLISERFDKKAIPVRNLIQFLCKNTRDSNKETKILKTLDLLELPCREDTVIDPDQFTFNKFVRFYMEIMERREIDTLFDQAKPEIDIAEGLLAMMPGGKHRRYLNWEKIRDFIVKQNDARGDAFGMNYYDQKAKDLVKKYTQHNHQFKEKGMCDESFLRYLLSFDNLVVDPTKFDLCMDMDKPLAHYFIASSHNTYLTGSQLKGRASTEMYRQVLLTGCRCIELDVVDSERRKDEPEIKHKNTPVRSVPFEQVIRAINECAFKVTPYPLILSIENHCSPRAQAKMAQYLVDILGDSLLTQPLKTHPIEDNCALPSPLDLKYKILIKNKKRHHHTTPKTNPTMDPQLLRKGESLVSTFSDQNPPISSSPSQSIDSLQRKQLVINEIRNDNLTNDFDLRSSNDNQANDTLIEDDDNTSDEEDILATTGNGLENTDQTVPASPVGIASSDSPTTMTYPTNSDGMIESKATQAMSDLVHYIVPVSFTNFIDAEKRNRSYEISSFAEEKAQNLIRDYAKEFVAYNQRQLSRIYPRGTRFDSSNYNPYHFWPVGCQMVALNYQTLDVPMQVNLGLFSFNGACGYLEKPPALCQSTGSFDPKGRLSVENVVIYQIEIKVISGQFLCQDREPTYVDIEMYGMYADATKRHEYRLRAKRWNGFQAVYDDTDVKSTEYSIRFSKVILPEMAALRFAVSDEDGTFIGQSFIPVAHLRPGYRHVVLRNQINIPVQCSSLYVHIKKDVHVDEENKEFIDLLISPTSVSTGVKEQQTPTQVQSSSSTSKSRSQSISDLNVLMDDLDNGNQLMNDNILFPSNGSLQQNPLPTDIPSGQANAGIIANRKRLQSTAVADASLYQNRLIGGSRLYDGENLCRELSLDELEQTKYFKRKQETIDAKVRRAALEYEKRIQNEEERFQKCLNRPNNGIYPVLQRTTYVDTRASASFHQKYISEEIKQAESRLLDLYCSKFHTQNELEYKLFKDYYNELEKHVTNYYMKQSSNIDDILKQEQAKVKNDVLIQMKTEIKRTMVTETDRERIEDLKEKIRQMNIEAGALAIRKLQDMHEQLLKTIQTNLQTAINHIHQKRDQDTKNRFTKYSNLLNEIKHRLQCDIYGNETLGGIREYFPSAPLHRSTIPISTSLTAIASHPATNSSSSPFNTSSSPSHSHHSNQASRRQTIDIHSPLISQSDDTDDQLVLYFDDIIESTRL